MTNYEVQQIKSAKKIKFMSAVLGLLFFLLLFFIASHVKLVSKVEALIQTIEGSTIRNAVEVSGNTNYQGCFECDKKKVAKESLGIVPSKPLISRPALIKKKVKYIPPPVDKSWSKSALRSYSKRVKYINTFLPIALKEQKIYGIPASIKLGMGILESKQGESILATKGKNHFGIKCFSGKCKKGHCMNAEDDTHKDFFRMYKSSWDSYRAHSKILKLSRYKKAFKCRRTDYECWAQGIKAGGYATDPNYVETLTKIIEELHLSQLDR